MCGRSCRVRHRTGEPRRIPRTLPPTQAGWAGVWVLMWDLQHRGTLQFFGHAWYKEHACLAEEDTLKAPSLAIQGLSSLHLVVVMLAITLFKGVSGSVRVSPKRHPTAPGDTQSESAFGMKS